MKNSLRHAWWLWGWYFWSMQLAVRHFYVRLFRLRCFARASDGTQCSGPGYCTLTLAHGNGKEKLRFCGIHAAVIMGRGATVDLIDGTSITV